MSRTEANTLTAQVSGNCCTTFAIQNHEITSCFPNYLNPIRSSLLFPLRINDVSAAVTKMLAVTHVVLDMASMKDKHLQKICLDMY